MNLVANDKDRQTLANNPMGTKDAIDEMFFEEQAITTNVEILATNVTYEVDADGQRQAKEELVVREMMTKRPDYAAQNIVAMIMQRVNVAFLPDVESFANAGQWLNGHVINDRASLTFALNVLDHEIQLVPQDYIDCPDFADHKPCLYVVTKNVGFHQRNVEWIDDRLKNGGDKGRPLVKPWHSVAGGH